MLFDWDGGPPPYCNKIPTKSPFCMVVTLVWKSWDLVRPPLPPSFLGIKSQLLPKKISVGSPNEWTSLTIIFPPWRVSCFGGSLGSKKPGFGLDHFYKASSIYIFDLLAPSGALVFIMVYYKPLFQIFQILQIRKWKWKWKDPTCAIFLKSIGFEDIEYDIPVYQM